MVQYKINEEIIGEPSLKVDEKKDDRRFAEMLSKYSGISQEKLEYFLEKHGVEILHKPDIMGLDNEQAQKLEEILIMLEGFNKKM